MSIALQLDQMSTEDKIRTMECLWDDLCRRAEVSSPLWHQAVLLKRERDIVTGNAKFSDWEVAKNKIRDSL
jgi:hypothetical protein